MTRFEMMDILEQGSKIIRENDKMYCFVKCHKEYERDRKALIQKCPDCGTWLTLGKEATTKLKAINYDEADRKRWRRKLESDILYLKRNKEPFRYLLKSIGLKFNKKEELVNCK